MDAIEDEGFTKEQQDLYFYDRKCPVCGSEEIGVGSWREHSFRTRTRECCCGDCDGEWREVRYWDAVPFLEPASQEFEDDCYEDEDDELDDEDDFEDEDLDEHA